MTQPGFQERVRASSKLVSDATPRHRLQTTPLAYRFLWSLGAKVPPPHFQSFEALALLHGVGAGAGFWLMWLAFGSLPSPFIASFFYAFVAGVVFGAAMAGLYTQESNQLGLPKWSQVLSV